MPLMPLMSYLCACVLLYGVAMLDISIL